MPTQPPYPVPWPLSTWPGATTQESAGRLINCHSEPLGEGGPAKAVWHRSPGLTQFAVTAQSGYRGGLLVGSLSYEAWSGNASTVTSAAVVTSLGTFPGTKKISIARDQASPADVVAVDLDNGAYVLSGGGAPTAYNGGGNLPQPNSVTFQDGYFFYGIGDLRVFASPLNSVGTINALTFITLQAKSSVTGQRVIAFSGLLFCFTTASCEVWQDAANVAPAFPYSRLVVLEYGLLDPRAIAGFEDGFSVLLWVAQDFGVYMLTPGSLQPLKVSTPDLDRLIENQSSVLGNELDASCYAFAGKKFWVLSTAGWTWEFNINTGKWNEKQSFSSSGQGPWRGVGGHPAFGLWLCGDSQSGTLAFIDDRKQSELGSPLTFRMESGPVVDFPNRMRVARADFDFIVGTGSATRSLLTNVTGAVAGVSNQIKLTVISTDFMFTGDYVTVAGVGGTTEANGTWVIIVNDATHLTLQGSNFVHAYTSGGTVTDTTPPAELINPQVAISWSDDGGNIWRNPLMRSLGMQTRSKTTRVSVKNTGTSAAIGRRWRIDVSERTVPSFLGSTQDHDPRVK